MGIFFFTNNFTKYYRSSYSPVSFKIWNMNWIFIILCLNLKYDNNNYVIEIVISITISNQFSIWFQNYFYHILKWNIILKQSYYCLHKNQSSMFSVIKSIKNNKMRFIPPYSKQIPWDGVWAKRRPCLMGFVCYIVV